MANKKKSVSVESVQILISMGFTKMQAEGSLEICDNNLERAMDYLFYHPDEDFSNSKQEKKVPTKKVSISEYNKDNASIYDLYSFITHLGKNTSHGHYVCHMKKGGEWIYYNDVRVNKIDEPPVHKGYIYLFKNKSNK